MTASSFDLSHNQFAGVTGCGGQGPAWDFGVWGFVAVFDRVSEGSQAAA